jgi:hypothetical protein
MIADGMNLNGISEIDEENTRMTKQLNRTASEFTVEELMISYNTYLIQVRGLV